MSTTVESLELEILSNSTSAAKGIDALTQSLTRLKSATKGLGLSGVASETGKVRDAMDKVSESNTKTSASFANLSRTIRGAANMFKSLGRSIFSAIEKSSDYVENVNLFTVAMGDYAAEAKEYAETVSEAMGIDPGEWMRNQGVFMTLATGFGVASDKAALMSKNLTQLTYDMSSFFNMSYEDAAQKLQSAIAGELEPVRRVGYDLSQAALKGIAMDADNYTSSMDGLADAMSDVAMEQFAISNGASKSFADMTQAEKSQLRYIALMKQVTVVQGDMARTLESPANQLRVFKAQLSMAAREIGNIFIPALNAILPYAIAVTKVIRALASTIASIVGFEMPEVDYSGVNSMTNAAEGTGDALDNAADEAKKLKSYMLGFDELNVINPNEDSSADVSDALGDINFKLPEYDFLSGLAETKVSAIVKDMKEWLGITDDIDSWSELFETRLGRILILVGGIGTGILAWKVTNTFMASIATLKTLLATPSFSIAIGITLAITGITLSYMAMKEAIEKGLDGFNFGEIVGNAILGTAGAALLGKAIITWFGKVCSTEMAFAIARLGMKLGLQTSAGLGAGLAAGVAGIILGIPMYITGIIDAIKNEIDGWSATLIGLGATLTGAGIGFLVGGPLGAAIGAAIGLAVGLITDFTIWFWQKFEEIEEWFKGLPGWAQVIISLFAGLMGGIYSFIMGVITVIKKWDEISAWVDKNVIQPVAKFFKGLWEDVSGFFKNLWRDIENVWNTVATWFDETVVRPVVGFFESLWGDVSSFFSQLWTDIENVWNTVATWFDENVISPIRDVFEGVTMRISQFFEGCWIIIRAVWYLASTWFDENVIQPVVGFFKGLWESVSGFFVQLWADIEILWITVSTWFDENVIQPVVGFFKGLWESVSGFFKSLWDDVKKVWGVVSTWFDENVIQPVVGFFKGLWESVSGFFKSLWDDIVGVWNKVSTWFDETIIEPVKTAFSNACKAIGEFFDKLWLGIRQGVANAMNGVIGGIESAINWVVKGINGLIGGFNKVVQWAADVIGEDWGGVTLVNEVSFQRITVPAYGEGGFPAQGQLFVAREAGAEMVGNIGRRTAVANNDQIVSGIAGGVAEANEEQNALLREQNSLLRALLEKDNRTYLDGKALTQSVEKYQRERGRVIVSGGVL